MATIKEIIEAKATADLWSKISADAGFDTLISLAEDQTCETVFGDNYNLAVALRVLHEYIVNNIRSGATGPVTMVKEGDLQVQYGGGSFSSGDIDDLESTSYGKQLESLIRVNTLPFGTNYSGLGSGC